jgi:[ribosomal protein S5]-alanine N-acetyltransferase
MEDLDAMHRILSNAEAMRYWDTLPHDDLEQTRVWLAAMVADSLETSDDFIVEHRGRVIGKAGCWRSPEIGFIFHPDHWRQGFAHEALTAVIPHIFATLPIAAIEAEADPRNQASLRLLARLGFQETRRARHTIKLGDEWCDSVYLALPRPA